MGLHSIIDQGLKIGWYRVKVMIGREDKRDVKREGLLSGNNSYIIIIIILLSPIIYTLAVAYDTYRMSWNEGRGGFLFALAFMIAEIVGIRVTISRVRLYAMIACTIVILAYFASVENGYREVIRGSASIYNVRLVDSWVWLWDYVAMGLFSIAILALAYGKRWVRIAPASPIYLLGSAVILSLDAFFPYNTLGPLQFIVPYLLQFDAFIINTIDSFVDIGSVYTKGNMIILNGHKGSMALQVFWPSAGVHSIIIYSLVMLAFLLKMNIDAKRKVLYFGIGVVGTVFVNTLRILSLSLYVLLVSADVNSFESFHSVAGEIMFLPWLAGYLFLIMHVEGKRAKSKKAGISNQGA
jgi:thaumarchaeosortase